MALKQIINLGESFRVGLNYAINPSYSSNLFRTNSINYIRRLPSRSTNSLKRNPFELAPIETAPANSSKLVKSLIFTVAFSAGSFIGVSIWEYEKIRKRHYKSSLPWFKNKIQTGQKKMSSWRKEIENWWNSLTPGDQLFVPICALNVAVFALWRVPRLQPFMIQYFCSNLAARAVCWPMVLSTFSHYSMFHIFANMYVLHSFTIGAVAALGKEQFLGLYLSAGVFSAYASYIYKAVSGRGGLSLGASGAIMGILAYVCSQYPDTKLSILFLPMYTFSAGVALKCIMGIDMAGLILGWKYFDHAAHLGGAFFGLFWCYYGSQYLWPKREKFLRYYHSIRSKPTSK